MKSSKKFLHAMILLTMMTFFMFGCGNTQGGAEISSDTEDVVAETPETTTEVEDPAEEVVEVVEPTTEEQAIDEPKQELVEDPGEVTYITDFITINEYVDALDSNQPAILIYNETEKYIINMQEGQHYELKSADKFLFNFIDADGYGWNFDLVNGRTSYANYSVLDINYSVWEVEQEFFIKKLLDNGDIIQRTCYFTPPTE